MEATLAPKHLNGQTRRWRVPGGTLMVWTASHTPFDLKILPDKRVGMILGEAIANDSPRRYTAEDVLTDWSPLTQASGYFCWLVIGASGELFAGTDPFGLFPLYTMNGSSAFGLATSTSVLRSHPDYDSTLDLVGLARHLIENGGVSARTVERGSRRLETGQVVNDNPDRPTPPVFLDRSVQWLSENKITEPQEAVQLSVDMSESAYKRHVIDSRAMLMSGGLDTRHLGALAIRSRHKPDGFTYGEALDFEAVQARRTCRKIGGKWHILPDQLPPVNALLEEELQLFSLAGGFSTVTLTGYESLPRLGVPRCTTGLLLDNHYSPMFLTPASFEPDTFAYSMELWINRFGFPAQELLRCARSPDMRDAVQESLAEIEAEWASIPGELTDRLWQVIMRNRMRPHLGSHLWKICFHTWPQLIATDVEFAKAMRRVSGELHRGRFLQRQTLTQLSPALARIPLDNMQNDPKSILPSRWNKWYRKRHLQQLSAAGITLKDAQRYPRLMSADSPPWQEIRKEAESGRAAMEGLFDPDALRDFLPVFPENINPVQQTFRGQWGLRMATGAMLWLGSRT